MAIKAWDRGGDQTPGCRRDHAARSWEMEMHTEEWSHPSPLTAVLKVDSVSLAECSPWVSPLHS